MVLVKKMLKLYFKFVCYF